ncbi:HAD family hydrolase [Auraticoccus monumenti]|uniref:Tyrosine-protein kinase PtkA n=1 Tax=Auraticoccus monumenti TaxID=675864 RepID=A0A1G6RPB7_9ACTN|nr:HAD-IA family hydrolase [Auraticoccus monumenti]SDD06540.1 pyrophosphatase PpaX [Auraticoccus monumenti]
MVLFDFDGTLGDTIALIVASYRHALSSVAGLEVDDTEARSWIGRPLLGVLQERHPEHAEAMIEAYRDWNRTHHDTLIRPVPGMVELLDGLAAAGARTMVVSSKVTETVRLGLTALGLDQRLPDVVGQGDTEHHKPHPQPLLLAASRLGVEPGECVYVGDATVDVMAAKAAGMTAVAVTWGAGERAELTAAGADTVVDDVDGLAGTLGVRLTPGW